MLKLYTVTVWHTSEPRHFETIEVRTYTARRAEELASESFPGCKARTSNLLVERVLLAQHAEAQQPGLKIAS